MEKELFSLNEITEWYKSNVLINLPIDFLIYMVTKGVLVADEKSLYSLSKLNDFLLQKQGEDFVEIYGKHRIKPNRRKFIETFRDKTQKITQTKKQYKIASLDGKNFKLIKL